MRKKNKANSTFALAPDGNGDALTRFLIMSAFGCKVVLLYSKPFLLAQSPVLTH
jgi:hypothetical protein